MNFNDPSFLEQIKLRDHQALTLLIEKYHDQLYFAVLKNKLSEDQAEEIVQSTWATFFEKVENFEGRSHIRTYLFGILFNKIKETWRSNKKYASTEQDDLENVFEGIFDHNGFYLKSPEDPSQWVQSKEFSTILQEELEKLPENQRLAFYLKEIQGEPSEEICNILGVTSTNLGVLIYRAKNTLRLKLEKRLSH